MANGSIADTVVKVKLRSGTDTCSDPPIRPSIQISLMVTEVTGSIYDLIRQFLCPGASDVDGHLYNVIYLSYPPPREGVRVCDGVCVCLC